MKIGVIILILFLSANLVLAQEDSWQLTLVNGDTIHNVCIQNLKGDSLSILQAGLMSWVRVDSIVEIREIRESELWDGAIYGSLIGTLLGGLIAGLTYEEPKPNQFVIRINAPAGATLGCVSGFILGLVIGGTLGIDVVYDLSEKSLESKLEIIERLLRKWFLKKRLV